MRCLKVKIQVVKSCWHLMSVVIREALNTKSHEVSAVNYQLYIG